MASAEYPGPTCGCFMSAVSGSWWVHEGKKETLEVSENGGHRGKLGNLVDKIGARSLS